MLADEHTCLRSNKSRSVTCKWVAGELVNKLRISPNLIQREAEEWFKVEYDISVGERMMYKAIEMAKDIIEGTEKEQYGKLRNYLSELLKANPGSTCTMSTHPQPEGLPKFRTVGQDTNNHLFPIAYAVVDAETKENWKWFLNLLHEDIDDYKEFGWNFMSDKQKRLVPALQEVMPKVSHRFCVMHMWHNLNKRWKDKELRGALWQCARAMTDLEFKNAMAYVKRINVGAWEYLSSYEQSS
ncbi:uncharacterized protein [Arachis hypogaea]|uniref:uncharacterized protein n=1 Tax=Arachis hypogaea TaxID=3818 RepID=UPI003B2123E1